MWIRADQAAALLGPSGRGKSLCRSPEFLLADDEALERRRGGPVHEHGFQGAVQLQTLFTEPGRERVEGCVECGQTLRGGRGVRRLRALDRIEGVQPFCVALGAEGAEERLDLGGRRCPVVDGMAQGEQCTVFGGEHPVRSECRLLVDDLAGLDEVLLEIDPEKVVELVLAEMVHPGGDDGRARDVLRIDVDTGTQQCIERQRGLAHLYGLFAPRHLLRDHGGGQSDRHGDRHDDDDHQGGADAEGEERSFWARASRVSCGVRGAVWRGVRMTAGRKAHACPALSTWTALRGACSQRTFRNPNHFAQDPRTPIPSHNASPTFFGRPAPAGGWTRGMPRHPPGLPVLPTGLHTPPC